MVPVGSPTHPAEAPRHKLFNSPSFVRVLVNIAVEEVVMRGGHSDGDQRAPPTPPWWPEVADLSDGGRGGDRFVHGSVEW